MGAGQEQRPENQDEDIYPLRPSLFPHTPPYLRFLPVNGDQSFKVPPPEELREMLWQVPCTVWWTIMECIEHNGYTVAEVRLRQFEACISSGAVWDSLPITEKNTDSIEFEKLNEAVKINQWPGMAQLGRKDNLFTNYARMREDFGKDEWSYMPHTYILPGERDLLRRAMKRAKNSFWIIKPPNLFCGMGIKVINDFKDVPVKKGPLCVQRYLKKPLLINGLKFDLRVYVLVTSVEPLRVFLYEEGLARFATEPYSNDPEQISNNFVHLTNFSINKESEKFVQNINPEEAEGSKWTLTSLWKQLKKMGIEKGPIWAEVREIVIKSILSGLPALQKGSQEQVNSYYNCYKMLGYDIFIDDKLRPHLIEVNTLPSLAAVPNTIDSHVKSPLVAEMFNIVGFHIPQSLAGKHQSSILTKLGWHHSRLQPIGHDRRLYCKSTLEEDSAKQEEFSDLDRDQYLDSILENLTPQDVRLLVHAEDELSQTKVFTRIWPTNQTHKYFRYFKSIPYSEKLMDAYEYFYADHRGEGVEYVSEYCEEKTHLKMPKQILERGDGGDSRGPEKIVIPAVFQVPRI